MRFAFDVILPVLVARVVGHQYGTLTNLPLTAAMSRRYRGRGLSIADARVHDQVHDVGGEVYEDVGESNGEDAAL